MINSSSTWRFLLIIIIIIIIFIIQAIKNDRLAYSYR